MNIRDIQDWLINKIAELLQADPGTIDIRETFSNYGLSSLDLVTLSGDLEELIGRRLSPTLAYDYPNILTLSLYLSESLENNESSSSEKLNPGYTNEPIAVIGMGCRFPGAKDPESFWQILRDGVDMITEVPADRWNAKKFYHPDPSVPGKSISMQGGFLDNVGQFDPFFFGISPGEAKFMDPQQRLLLELSYEALDDAGQINSNSKEGQTGVFIGISLNEYSQLQFDDPLSITGHSGTGNALSIAANRISYFFNFHGPSMAIDTACSSSLTAVHLACQSIRSGECGMALAGGVNIILSPAHSIAFTKAGVLAPDGRCKTFDASANGYVRGEGGGVIVLKPLSAALADGDHIHALILGSAIGQDGHTNGLMAPSQEGQEAMLREAYRNAGVSPAGIQYIEAHGTGTLLGDSMEAKALGAIIGANRSNSACAIGSVKTNIGHLEAAAGIAGLIKTILSLKHRVIPPSLHYQSPNPHIDFNALNLKVQNELAVWKSDSGPATAGVSSFGFGGTNVHLIVREVENRKQEVSNPFIPSVTDRYLLPLSAHSPEALHSLAGSMLELLAEDSPNELYDICYAAGKRRSHFDHRLAVLGHSKKELFSNLKAFVHGEQEHNLVHVSETSNRQPKLAFVFSGQGGQWFGMGRELLKQEPVFYKTIERIGQAMQAYCPWSLLKELCAELTESRLTDIDVVQPAIFAIQVALAELWKFWGIIPDAVVGHSMGEVAAAYGAGILTLEDAVRIVCCRSQLLMPLRGKGSMLATELSPSQAKEWINGYDQEISIAVVNSPVSTVLSGHSETIRNVMVAMEQKNLFCRLVNVDVASHSPQIDLLKDELLQVLDGLSPKSPVIPMYSTVTGNMSDTLEFNANYWIDNLRKPVLFSDAIGNMLDDGHTMFVEIGPHPVLLGSIQQSIQSHHKQVRLLPSLRREEPERNVLIATLATLYTEGFVIEWDNFFPVRGKHIQLPMIPWQRQRYWLDKPPAYTKNPWNNDTNGHPLLGERIELANTPSSYVWQTTIDAASVNFLKDHMIENEIVFPAAGYIEMALQSLYETGLNSTHELADFSFKEKMIFKEGKTRFIQALLEPGEEGGFHFYVYSRPIKEHQWMLHASCILVKKQADNNLLTARWTTTDSIREKGNSNITAKTFYQTLQSVGIQYGPWFQAIQKLWNIENESLGLIQLPGSIEFENDDYRFHPALLDACFQVLAAKQKVSFENHFYLPTGCNQIRFFKPPGNKLWSQVILQPLSAQGLDNIEANIRILNETGEPVAELIGFRLQRTSSRVRQLLSRQDSWLYQLAWQKQAIPNHSAVSLSSKKHWLILADDEGLGEALATQLEADGDSIHLLLYNDVVHCLHQESFSQCIEQFVQAISSPLYGIIHLWSLSIQPPTSEKKQSVENREIAGCNSVLCLVQALSKQLIAMPRLWLVTRGSQPVKPGEPIAVEQSALWGLGKVISFELPELNCIRVDLDPDQSIPETVPLLVNQLLSDDREDQVAYRSARRFVPRVLPFISNTSSYKPALLFKEDGTYLITGGMGALGLKTAEWMIEKGARHLVLMGRTNPSLQTERIVNEWRDLGNFIVIALADVSIPDQLDGVLNSIRKNMPPLRGVIHCAGVLDDGSLLNLNAEKMKKVMAPKVDGAWNLHVATMDEPLDFFVLFSSAVSVLGSPGQANYAAASAYLDAMAHYRRNKGLPAISINWGPWADIGLAADTIEKLKDQPNTSQHLIKVIKIEQGLEILEQLLNQSAPQVMVLPFDLQNLIELFPTAAGMPFLSEVGGSLAHVARLYARPNLRQEYVAPRNEMERKLADLWRQTLHIDRVGVHDSFFELGGDSVLAAQILSLAQKAFGIRINPQDAFKAFTIERLAELLEADIMSRIEEMSDEEALRLLSK